MKNYLIYMDVAGDVGDDDIGIDKISLVPMEFVINGQPKIYDKTINGLDVVEFYESIKAKVDVKTTQVAPRIYEEIFEKYLSNGISILYLCLSSGLSSTYNSACIASKQLKEKYPEVDFLPIDSLSATVGMGILANKMLKNKQNGLDIHENFEDAKSMIGKIRCIGVIDDLTMLKRGGRISPATAFFGEVLKIKPIIQIDPNGKLSVLEKKKGILASLNFLLKNVVDFMDTEYKTLYLVHANEEGNASFLENKIKQEIKGVEIKKGLLSPIIGAHLGPGAVVVGFFKK